MTLVLLLLLFIQSPATVRGEIIDRIVAVVEGHIITLSDIRAERSMREVLGEPAPKDDRELLDELIDQHLVHPQLELFPEFGPTEGQLNSRLAEIEDRKGLSERSIRAALQEHMRTQRFFDERFRQFATATPDEITKYYQDVFLPAAQARGLSPAPSLKEVEEAIRRNVIEEKVAKQVDAWLQQTRKTSKVEIVP